MSFCAWELFIEFVGATLRGSVNHTGCGDVMVSASDILLENCGLRPVVRFPRYTKTFRPLKTV